MRLTLLSKPLALDIKIFHLNQLGIPQDRIAKRLGIPRKTLRDHLAEMPGLAFPPNSDLLKGFTVPQVAQKHGWPEPMVWSQALNKKDDQTRFKELNWGIRTWDLWNFIDCDNRFCDEWPGRIPAQLIAHILYFFSEQAILIVDYYEILRKTGWTLTHIIQAPLSSERFNPGLWLQCRKKRFLELPAGM
ncbi:MAG: hypothetical protein KKE12_19710 [Proteobacteria bacterium]|nr:hypothetical protein [Pseudomonadota bacterium]